MRIRLAVALAVTFGACATAGAAWAQVGARASAGAFARSCSFSDVEGYAVPSAHVAGSCNGDENSSASVEAASSLATGDLLVSELADTTTSNASANATAELFDRLMFSVPGGGTDDITVHVTFDLDGSMTAPQTFDAEQKFLRYVFVLTDANAFGPGHSLNVSDGLTAPNAAPLVFESDVLISWPYAAEVLAQLSGSSIYEGGLAYSSGVALSVPPGVTWTSQSGPFLAPESSSTLGGAAMLRALAVLRRAR